MRTKHLLMAMALPTIFAACSSDELETIQNGGNALKGRVDLGNVELSFGDDAQTRMTAEGGVPRFLTGDGVGACLVDDYNGKKPEKPEDILKSYQLTPYIQTNYQYKYDGSNWTTTARMVEGNYIFYAPYNGEHLSRTPLNTGVPVVQELAMGADGKLDQFSILDAFVKSGQPAYVGYKFLKAEGQTTKVKVDLWPIFAYPVVTFTNDNTDANAGDVTITKFVITTTSGFATEVPLKIGTGDNGIASSKGSGIVGSLFDETTDNKKKGAWVAANKNMIGNKTADVTDNSATDKKTANMITVNVPGGALKVAKGESVKFNVVIPAEAANTAYTIHAYLDNGKAYSKVISGAGYSAGKIYPDNQYRDGTALGTAATTMAWATNKQTLGDAPVIVNTTDELVSLVSSATDSEEVKNIQIGSSDVKITKAVADVANPTLTYTFANPISIAAGADAIALNNFVFKGDVTIESGDVTYTSPKYTAPKTASSIETVEKEYAIKATVKKDAKLTVLAADATSAVKTEAGAKAVIGSGEEEEETITTVATLDNEGETTINVEGAVTSVTSNKGTITNESGTLPETITGNWINNAEVTLNENTTIADKGKLTNNGTITTIAASGDKAASTLTIAKGGTLYNAAKCVITNSGSIIVNGTLEAYGYFRGNDIEAKKDGGCINLYDGYETTDTFSFSYEVATESSTTSYDGVLADVREEFEYVTNNEGNKPNVKPGVNLLRVKNLTIENAFVDNLGRYELQNGGTLTVKANTTVTSNVEITTLGDATISGIFKTLSGQNGHVLTIIVAKKKTLTLEGIDLGRVNTGSETVYGKEFTVLKGGKESAGNDMAKYKLTSGANDENCSVDVDVKDNPATTENETHIGTIKKVK